MTNIRSILHAYRHVTNDINLSYSVSNRDGESKKGKEPRKVIEIELWCIQRASRLQHKRTDERHEQANGMEFN